MKIFKLPDLGEGLTEAEIHEWHVKVGDEVKTDQLMVSMETAKAVVDVPAPCTGKIVKLFGEEGDIIDTDAPLVEFEGDIESEDAGSVVGKVDHVAATVVEENAMGVTPASTVSQSISALPAVKALARRLNVDLSSINGTGNEGRITKDDVKAAADKKTTQAPEGYEPLRSIRRTMAQSMSKSHVEIVPVTIFDDADLHAWPTGTDITARVIRAVVKACNEEPALNAWYDTASISRKIANTVNLGIAMDSDDGLFVPVIHDAGAKNASEWRETIERFKREVKDRSIATSELQGASITLSNFGTFAGRYATPIIVPPAVAIIGTGRIRTEAVATEQEITSHKVMPLSLTFDHRGVTGGEATRFLRAMIIDLQLAD